MSSLAHKIKETRNSIRKKYRALQNMKIDEKREIERTLKPIIKPLTNIAKIQDTMKKSAEDVDRKDDDDDDDDDTNHDDDNTDDKKIKLVKNKNESFCSETHKPLGFKIYCVPTQYKRRSHDVSSLSTSIGGLKKNLASMKVRIEAFFVQQ